jgi:ribosomal protein S18 acetylase RimI-like enzyme
MKIRPAIEDDANLIADAVIASVSAGTDTVIYEKLFELDRAELVVLLRQIATEDIEGQELTYPNYFILTDDTQNTLGCCAGWIEQQSNIQKAQIWAYYLGVERWNNAKSKLESLSDFGFEREQGTFQLDGVYIVPECRGKGLGATLIQMVTDELKKLHPEISKAQIILFKQNISALKAYMNAGYSVVKEIQAEKSQVLDFLPYDAKLLLEQTW